MKRLALALLVVLLAGPAAPADEPPSPRWLDLSGATVLGSPGVPRALDAFLPGGARPRPLAWPLPPGPVLLLGLPGSDPLAQRIADLFALPVDADDLAGGYRLWAWRDGDRPIAFLFAADAAALCAARFLFDADTRAPARPGGHRSLDFARPNEEAALGLPVGLQSQRPRYRVRALAPGGNLRRHDEIAVAGARGNRLWLDPRELSSERITRALPRLRRGGVAPVIVLRAGAAAGTTSPSAQALAAAARPWQRDHGVRHFAVVFDTPWADVRAAGETYGASEAGLVAALASRLRPGGLEAIAVVPRCHSDQLTEHFGPPPDLRAVPEARVAWSGPRAHSIAVSRADAERRVRAARGVPVLLFETWSAPFGGPAYVPTTPHGRDEALPDVLEGIVVVGRAGADATLAGAWGPAQPERFGTDLLLPLLQPGITDARRFLESTAARLHRAKRETAGIAPWMGPLGDLARGYADTLGGDGEAVLVPRVPEPIVVDGRLDERPWAFATRLPDTGPNVEVLVLADGSALRLGVRIRKPAGRDAPASLHLGLFVPGTYTLHAIPLGPGAAGAPLGTENGVIFPEAGHVTRVGHGGPDRYTAEVTLDRFALHGDALPGRCFQLTLVGPTAQGERTSPRPLLLVLVP